MYREVHNDRFGYFLFFLGEEAEHGFSSARFDIGNVSRPFYMYFVGLVFMGVGANYIILCDVKKNTNIENKKVGKIFRNGHL